MAPYQQQQHHHFWWKADTKLNLPLIKNMPWHQKWNLIKYVLKFFHFRRFFLKNLYRQANSLLHWKQILYFFYYYLSSFQSNSFNEMFLLNKDTLLYLLILIWNFWCTFSITEVNDLALHSKWQTTLLFNSWFYHHS